MLLNIEMSVSKEWSKKCYKDACISVEMFVRAQKAAHNCFEAIRNTAFKPVIYS